MLAKSKNKIQVFFIFNFIFKGITNDSERTHDCNRFIEQQQELIKKMKERELKLITNMLKNEESKNQKLLTVEFL